MEPNEEHIELKKLLIENSKVVQENNELLKKLRRDAKIALYLRICWYVILIGLPFALYFYVLEPYFTVMGSSYETFLKGMGELPGLKGIDMLINSIRN